MFSTYLSIVFPSRHTKTLFRCSTVESENDHSLQVSWSQMKSWHATEAPQDVGSLKIRRPGGACTQFS